MKSNGLRNTCWLVLLVIVLVAGLAACGDPNREDCKKACNKLVECDKPENGGLAALTEDWLISCKSSCDEADTIESDTADCILNTDCANIADTCSSSD